MGDRPLIELYQVLPGAPAPVPAGDGAVMSLPSKALRYCPPVISASRWGWHVFPPVDMALRFDGQQTDWRDAEGTWHRVRPGDEGVVPGWAEHYRERFPADVVEGLVDDTPGLFNADPGAPFRVEMYTGVIVRTAPGWSLLVRAPANMPRRTDLVLYEGIIETSWWVSLLPTIVELTTPGLEVELSRSRPLAQLQLVPADRDPVVDGAVLGGLEDIPADMWASYRENRLRRTGEDRLGSYIRTDRSLRRGGEPQA